MAALVRLNEALDAKLAQAKSELDDKLADGVAWLPRWPLVIVHVASLA